MTRSRPTYNLWTEPWITVEGLTGDIVDSGLAEVLCHAHEIRTIVDPSPLVVVGVHRLLTAIVHDIIRPQKEGDLARIWDAQALSEADMQAFGDTYTHRFDLFSPTEPFLQSADLPLEPERKASGLKPVSYLTKEIPAGSEVAHYRHGVDEDNVFCPACAARGLVTVSAFATSGGAGIKPSINGVPPIYVIPGDDTLFGRLAASLVLPDHQPSARSSVEDRVWWRHDPIVPRKAVVRDVGYLHSLTFPARRVRLHPERTDGACSRCGRQMKYGVRSMIFRMGESRPKDAQPWRDPFAAYRPSKADLKPIRPVKGKALWRDYAALFLPSREDAEGSDPGTLPPTSLYQRVELASDGIFEAVGPRYAVYPVRCVGIRTDMRAKVFEWLDAEFSVPARLARDVLAADEVRRGLDLATKGASTMARTFRQYFDAVRRDRFASLIQRMLDAYWRALAVPFRTFVLRIGEADDFGDAHRVWADIVVSEGQAAFNTHAEMTGADGGSLRNRVQARKWCAIRLNQQRKEYLPDEQSDDI